MNLCVYKYIYSMPPDVERKRDIPVAILNGMIKWPLNAEQIYHLDFLGLTNELFVH